VVGPLSPDILNTTFDVEIKKAAQPLP
jgi:hypothetical protein